MKALFFINIFSRKKSFVVAVVTVWLFLGFSSIARANNISTKLEKKPDGDWSVTFMSEKPIKRLAFKSSPDNSRSKRWIPTATGYQFEFNEGRESVLREDGGEFTEVTFHLTPTYTVLPKEYAPFSPFSDGGYLLHTGRFFACAESCQPSLNHWRLMIAAPESDNIILHGKIYQESIQWEALDEGSKIYIGHGKPIQSDHFVSVIDELLPEKLQYQMSIQLPKLMVFFADKMGALGYRPALFASYSSTDDGRIGHQGGTLPGQIFMHWYGDESVIETIDVDELFWLFSHEVAHLFQREGADVIDTADSWIHEGAADYFAGLAFKSILSKDFLSQKINQAEKKCLASLEDNPVYLDASRKNPRVHYDCGLLIINAIDKQLKEQGSISIYELWNLYSSKVSSGASAGADQFVLATKPYLSSEMIKNLEKLNTSEFSALKFISKLTGDNP
ncbi:hypothetical protein [Microbulbifer sp. THAF38]|uniref:hypothetical protein n=1 Tax=Microbulbifer sp. THAF38 TaxID=2587856 RepID=UPI0012683A15|nr:hypothetical protein [Microbulbifer sp. THAF38]QFT55680.1 hypothetical protein FIU95_14115 [Microbulbifer sp. THAF38]